MSNSNSDSALGANPDRAQPSISTPDSLIREESNERESGGDHPHTLDAGITLERQAADSVPIRDGSELPDAQNQGQARQYSSQGQPQSAVVEQQAYNTPFSQSEMAMPRSKSAGGRAVLWAVLGCVATVVVMLIGFLVYSSVQDPFRTLDIFPTGKYLNNYESVVGSRFRAKLTVVAELGGEFDRGRLLSFRDEATQRSLAVLIPPELGQIGFSKGQSYLVEIEVREGGLIYAHAFKKN